MPILGPTCHFYNIPYIIPISSPKDRVFIIHITRCILDAGWGREPSTIKNHMLEVKRKSIKCKYIVKAPSYPSFGPHRVKGLLVIGPAVDMLMRSLYPGSLSAFAQFDTFSSPQSDSSKVFKASVKGAL